MTLIVAALLGYLTYIYHIEHRLYTKRSLLKKVTYSRVESKLWDLIRKCPMFSADCSFKIKDAHVNMYIKRIEMKKL